jgi:plasmid stabilization system protein ParE
VSPCGIFRSPRPRAISWPPACARSFTAPTIYYQPHPNEIVIIRVLHGARDVTAIAEHGGFGE